MKQFLICFSLACMSFTYLPSSTSHQKEIIVKNDEDTRKAITQAILDNLIKEDYDAVQKDFYGPFKQALPIEKISEAWQQTVTTVGDFVKVLATTAATTPEGFNQIRLRCQFKNDNLTVETTFNEDDKVIGLYLKP